MKKILYVGWLGYKNVGDELMYDVFKERFYDEFDREDYKVIPTTKRVITKIKKDPSYLQNFEYIVLGGGSLLLPYFISIMYKAVQQNVKIMIWGSGIDKIRKEYIEEFMRNEYTPNQGKALFKKKFRQRLQTVIEQAKDIRVRGRLTYTALETMGMPTQNIHVSGDPGLLLNPESTNSSQEESNKIAINWGTSNNKIFGKNEKKMEEELVHVIEHLLNKGHHINIYAVWPKDLSACKRLYKKVIERNEDSKDNITMISKVYKQYDIMNMLSECRYSINFKLHANVMSAVTQTPFIALGYRFKTFDFAHSIGLEELVVSTDEANFGSSIIDKTQYIENNLKDLMYSIPEYQKQSEEGLNEIFNIIKNS